MSGFGIRAFKKLKEEQSVEEKRQYFCNIVYGGNAFAVLTYLKLRSQYGESTVKLLSPNYIDKQSVVNEWKCSLNTLRSETIAHKLIEKKPQLEITPIEAKVQFYKDSKFHDFGGRTKPYEIKEGEEYFTSSAFNLKKEALFSDEQWNELDELLRVGQLNKFLNKIELTQPQDLVEKTNYILHTGENESLHCENLYWCEGPKEFYLKVENKNKINDALGEFCNAVEYRSAMSVHFEVDKEIFEGQGTVFLPQSVTHEWGHFICDFKSFDPSINKQEFVCMMFVNEDEVNEEELAKKIRLMKRVIERTLPDFAKARHTEHIHYNQMMFIENVKDALKDDIEFDHSHLKFVGQGAPLGEIEHSQDYKFTSRAIMSFLLC